MIPYETFRLVVWIIGTPIILFLLWRIIQRIRAINKLDAEVRAEEEQMGRNPYAAYARMLEAQQLLEEARGKKKPDASKR